MTEAEYLSQRAEAYQRLIWHDGMDSASYHRRLWEIERRWEAARESDLEARRRWA